MSCFKHLQYLAIRIYTHMYVCSKVSHYIRKTPRCIWYKLFISIFFIFSLFNRHAYQVPISQNLSHIMLYIFISYLFHVSKRYKKIIMLWRWITETTHVIMNLPYSLFFITEKFALFTSANRYSYLLGLNIKVIVKCNEIPDWLTWCALPLL